MMAHEHGEEAFVDKDSPFAWLHQLCSSLYSFFSFGGPSGRTSSPSSNNFANGMRLCDAVYAFHEPQEQVDVEVVFIHSLEFDGSKEAYWKTWLARDGTPDNCWPKTWLAKEFPHARILSLSYDANVVQTLTSGRMDPYSLGESLVQEMTLVGVGQQDCPILFVCHGLGGLVAKQIVVKAYQNPQRDKEVQNLLRNLRAFYFYATPHGGVQVDLAPWNLLAAHGPCMSYLKAFSPEVGRLNSEFEQIHREVYNNEWMCFNVGEMHGGKHGKVVVPESSARQVGYQFLASNSSHFDICRPKCPTDSTYQFLTNLVLKVIKVHEGKRRCLLDLPNGLVGMTYMQNTICEKLGIVSIFGLVGMGGIGKTTISKFVYNSQAKFYDKTCFLQDVRSKGVAFVQKELLQELCGVTLESTEGVSSKHLQSMKKCIKERRVLIVIDDAGDSNTLKALQVPTFQRSMSNGSRVIVTCRNRQVLENHVGLEHLKDVEIMDVDFLNDSQALELFHYHVFCGIEDKDDEMEDFQGLASTIAKACCGLPLSLEVIGQHLRKQHVHSIGLRKGMWEKALRDLHDAESFDGSDDNEVLWKRLKISYDDLSPDTKSMFLDFACFFCEKQGLSLSEESIGWIWSSPIGLQNLLARSLIKVGGIGKRGRSFTMHDQLRDMGRRIVKDLSLENLHVSLKKMTRLWELKEVVSFLEEDQGSRTIEGVTLFNCSEIGALQSQANPEQVGEMRIQRFDRLRLLDLTECKPKVVEFCLRKCGEKLSWLCLDQIRIQPLAIGAIGSYIGLRVLQMRGCSSMEDLPASIGNLIHLLELDLTWCKNLRSLPYEIGHLKQLKRLQLWNCCSLEELPSSASQLTTLQYLGLRSCSRLVRMVEFETQMDHLYELDLSGCEGLQISFKSLGKLHQLRTLNMEKCYSLVIWNPSQSFGQLSRLQKLNLASCTSLVSGSREEAEGSWDLVTKSFSSRLQDLHLPAISRANFPYLRLKVLNFVNAFCLEELPAFLWDLVQLKSLTVRDAYPRSLRKLSDSLCSLVKLVVLELLGVEALERLPDKLGHLSSLKTLSIDGMNEVEELPASLGQLTLLKYLDLQGCASLKGLPESLTSLPQLSRLKLKDCKELLELPAALGQLSQLQHLNLQGCESLTHLPESLTSLPRLSRLILKDCKELVELPTSLGQLSQLKNIDLQGCESLTHLPESLTSLPRLSSLILKDCKELVELPTSFGQLSQLEHLDLQSCTSLKSLPESLTSLPQLSSLILEDCKELVELPASLGQLSQLEYLYLQGCTNLKCLPESLISLLQLSILIVEDCKESMELPISLGQLSQLKCLDLQGCESLTHLPESLTSLPQLSRLILKDCKELVELPASLGQLSQLEHLDLQGCISLKSLPKSLTSLPRLSSLILEDCKELVELPTSLGRLSQLQHLNLQGCTSLKCLPESFTSLT